MANPGLKRNLVAGFGLSVLILVISSTASYVSIRHLLHSSFWLDHTYQVIGALENVNLQVKNAESAQREFLLTSDSSFLQPYQQSKGNALASVALVRSLTIDNPPQTVAADRLRLFIIRRLDTLDQGLLAIKGKRKVSVPLLIRGNQEMISFRTMIDTMENRERVLLALRTRAYNKFSRFTPTLIIGAALIFLIITVIYYFRVMDDYNNRVRLENDLRTKDKEINRRIEIIRDIANRISSGNYDTRATDEWADGLGNLAFYLNKMGQSLEYSFGQLSARDWLQTGAADLNEILMGDKELGILCEQAVAYVAEYCGASMGALYVMEGAQKLVIKGGYALPGETRADSGRASGLVDQAVKGQKEILVAEIGEGNIYTTYAAGQIHPIQVLAMPVMDGLQVVGALELGSLRAFSSREMEFLRAVSHSIGVAISVTVSRKRLQDLLEETQSQAEELQMQHSHMETLNSELETQAQKLQASEEELRVQQEELLQANQELHLKSKSEEEKNRLILQRNAEIQAKAEELGQSTRYKSEFLANMSHELRTPLNSILLLSRLLSEDAEKNLTADQLEYARVIQSSGKGLLSLIDEILDLSKIESGKMDMEWTVVRPPEVADEMRRMFESIAREKKLDLEITISPEIPPSIETDKMRLEQVLRNLISNALKFTSRGSVRMVVEKDPNQDGYLCFNVVDTGIGIPADKQAQIFEAFQQADGSTRRKYGGTGLGLSISRQLARLLKGDILVTSEPGKGSTFTLWLPMSRSQAKPEESPRPAPSPGQDLFLAKSIPESVEDDRDQIQQGDRIIQIVEDDINFARSLLAMARKRGYKGLVTVRGDEAAPDARRFLPAGILLDIQLPVKSGWEVMNELKTHPSTRHIPVHVMSSFELKKESMLKGAVDFIRKPAMMENLQQAFEKIEKVLARERKVLIVEDNSRHAQALAYFLESYNLSAEVKTSLPQTIKTLQQGEMDCVILNMDILATRSYSVLEEIKKTHGLENLPIIVFTKRRLSGSEEIRIRQYAETIVLKTAHSYQDILNEVNVFLRAVGESQGQDGQPQRQMGQLNEVLKNKTILLADDDPRNLVALSAALNKHQVQVITAADGFEALEKLKANGKVDAILLDMMMPQMDGYDLTRTLRMDARWKKVPIIAVTAKAMASDMEKCISAGASDFVTKPVDIDQLLSLLRVWLYEKDN